MPTPSIQTLRADAQQVLNLDSISAVRSVVAATLANANAGTPLNPNLTTQQLWNEFYQIVTQPKSDIESIIANQLMKFMYAPPAPGGVGANGQVIFNDGGVLAGDVGLQFNKTTDTLQTGALIVPGNVQLATVGTLYVGTLLNPKLKVDVGGTGVTTITEATITGDLTVATDRLKVTGGNVGIGTATPTNYANYTTLTINGTNGGEIDLTDGGTLRGQLFSESTGLTLAAVGGLIKFGAGTGGTEKMRIDSSGNVGVGVTPSAWVLAGYKAFEIGVPGNGIYSGNGDFNVGTNVYYSSGWKYAVSAVAASSYQQNAGQHIWKTASAGTAGNSVTDFNTPKMVLDVLGNLNVAVGNIALGTSGKGIDFSATASGSGTMASELLSDYEEGTFTPTVSGSTSAGTGTYSNQNGFYTKVGRLVTVTVYLNWTAHTGTGNLRFSNLPFTAANVAGNYNGISIGFVSNIALTAGNVLYGLVEYGTSYITATQTPTGGGGYSTVPIDTAGEIAFTATYYV